MYAIAIAIRGKAIAIIAYSLHLVVSIITIKYQQFISMTW